VTRRPRRGPPFAKASRPRKIAGVMNGLERAYGDLLNVRKAAGQVAEWWYEAVTLKLAPDCRYNPDFLVMLPDGSLEFHETKGFQREDSIVKLKAAAEKFPFRFVLVQKQTKKQGGGWKIEEVRSDSWSEAA
jgi:hypothetical protein